LRWCRATKRSLASLHRVLGTTYHPLTLQHRVLVPRPAGEAARQRAAEVHRWVPDPRRQDVERPRVERRSVHDHDYDHDDYNHDDAPPRVVKTVIRDSGNTQWPVLTKTNYVE
jgi:hypothetical protein